VPNKNQNIVAKRLTALKKVLREKDLDMILICSSLQEFGFGFSVSGIKPIYYHYFFLSKQKLLDLPSPQTRKNKPKAGREGITTGYFVPYFLVERLGLDKRPGVVTFDDKKIAKDMRKFLSGAERVGILGPAPAVHFSRSHADLVFLDDELWPILQEKSKEEINQIKETSYILADLLEEIKWAITPEERMDLLAEHLDKEILRKGDDVAFPSLVESRHGNKNILYLLGLKAKIKQKDLIYINIGAQKNGFFADAGRTYFVNNPVLEKKYRKFEQAFFTFVKALRPGQKLADLPGQFQKQLEKVGLKKIQLKDDYIGHSIGFSIINLPFISKNLFQGEKLQDRTTWSLVVECLVDGQHFQLQDTLLITERGGQILTR
jgi:hypothetical protein